MIRHILRLVWNRKASNALIMAEIALSFLVVFVVAALAVFFFHNSRQPMGYEADDFWRIWVNGPRTTGEEAAERQEIEHQIMRELASIDAVAHVSVFQYVPYAQSTSISSWELDGNSYRSEVITVSEGFEKVAGMELVTGRWFQPGDEHLAFNPVLINERLAEEIFGNEDPLGRSLRDPREEPEVGYKEQKVVGVFTDYRKNGEFDSPRNMLFRLQTIGNEERFMQQIGLRMQPGTPAAVEELLLDRLSRLAPGWSFGIASVVVAREDYRRGKLLQLTLAGAVAGFLVLMVGLGLLGVLWQSVSQRTQEIGLRRANGADARRIYQQILTEILVVAALALLVGTVIVVQLPLTGLLDFLTPPILVQGFVLALLFMMGLAAVCGLYPSWLAARVQPAEALHYD